MMLMLKMILNIHNIYMWNQYIFLNVIFVNTKFFFVHPGPGWPASAELLKNAGNIGVLSLQEGFVKNLELLEVKIRHADLIVLLAGKAGRF